MVKKSEYVSVDGLMDTPQITMWMFQSVINSLNGRLLTILEASVSDKEQRNAMKTLVRKELWGTYDKVRDWSLYQKEGQGSNFPFITTPEKE